MATRTVLIHEYVTGGGWTGQGPPASLAAEGAAMRRALAADFAAAGNVRVLMTLDDRDDDEPGPWETVRVHRGREIATLQRLADEVDDVVLVAPETDDLLAQRSALLAGGKARHLGSSTAAIGTTSDKLTLARHLAREGIATPESEPVFTAGDLPDLLPYPLVLKPIDGAGAIDTFLLTGPDDRPEGAFRHLPALVQPYVPGDAMSASFLVDATGTPHLVAVARQLVEVFDGRFAYLGGTVPAGSRALADEARRAVAGVPGLRGWVGVDFIVRESDGRSIVLEINPRATTSFVGIVRLLPPGMLARAWLAAFDRPDDLATLDLAAQVHAKSPLSFTGDGTITLGVTAP